MAERLRWERDGRDWPHREHSHFVEAGGLRWHVQSTGEGDSHIGGDGPRPSVLLLHGTGASTHSWRDVIAPLARHAHVVAPDLPGHGFSTMPAADRFTLPGMARAVHALLQAMQVRPSVIVGHSAGAAVAVQMCADHVVTPDLVVSLNGALLPWGGLPGPFFTPVARAMAGMNWLPRVFASQAARPAVLRRLIAGTGSTLDERGHELYGRLVCSPGHVTAALSMMAHWDLAPLAQALPSVSAALLLVVGEHDRTVPPELAQRVQALRPDADLVRLPGLGHLAHEERPGEVVRIIVDAARARGLLARRKGAGQSG